MKTVSIIGSCNSRELFNYEILKNEFQIDFYAFQTNLWDLFSEPLNVDMSFINQIPMEQFYRRMFDLDVNKKIISRLEEKQSEYLVIDFYIMTRDMLRISKGNDSVYINNVSYQRIHNFINSQRKMELSSRIVPLDEIDQSIVFAGLDNLADFAKTHYKQENVIVFAPVFSTKYCNTNGDIVNYSVEEIENIKKSQAIVDLYTNYFLTQIPNAKKFVPESTREYACYRESDFGVLKPNFTHHPKYDEVGYAYQFYNLIFEQNLECPRYEYLSHEYDNLTNRVYKLANLVFKTTYDAITSLNNYIYRILNLDKYIVAISARDNASTYLNKFISKNILKLNFPISFRQSYIGIVDKVGDYYFEQSSDNALEKEYVVRKNIIKINSAGYLCGNNSSILVNGVEYSLNKRGLNFAIIDNQTFEVVNQFCCDVHADENLLISLNPKY